MIREQRRLELENSPRRQCRARPLLLRNGRGRFCRRVCRVCRRRRRRRSLHRMVSGHPAPARNRLDAFAAEVRQAFDNAAPTGEELHELMAHYNITTTTARVCPHGSSPIPPARWPPRSRCTGCATPPPFTKTTARRKTPPPAASVTILRN